jgi:hypothetical protein
MSDWTRRWIRGEVTWEASWAREEEEFARWCCRRIAPVGLDSNPQFSGLSEKRPGVRGIGASWSIARVGMGATSGILLGSIEGARFINDSGVSGWRISTGWGTHSGIFEKFFEEKKHPSSNPLTSSVSKRISFVDPLLYIAHFNQFVKSRK